MNDGYIKFIARLNTEALAILITVDNAQSAHEYFRRRPIQMNVFGLVVTNTLLRGYAVTLVLIAYKTLDLGGKLQAFVNSGYVA